MTTQPEQTPVNVHVVSAAPGVMPASSAPVTIRDVLYTVVLTSNEPVKELLTPEPSRVYAIVQALDNPVVIAGSKGDAQSVKNTGDTTLADPNGAVIPTGVVVPFKGTEMKYVAAATYPSRVSVIAGYK